jgi:hypothetical protein
MTSVQMAYIMLVESKNELTKSIIMDRMHNRLLLKATGAAKQMAETLQQQNQTKMRYLKFSVSDLEEIYADEKEKAQAEPADVPTPPMDNKPPEGGKM